MLSHGEGTTLQKPSSCVECEARRSFLMENEMGFLQYHPIQDNESRDSIRLLQLLPGQRTDEIRCELKNVSLSEAPSYEAVSYCWGDAANKVSIICDGAQLEITRNLYSLLQHIRKADTARSLWADAICIDQSNIAERSSQVQRMRGIYSKSQGVLIWLGDAADGSDEAIVLAKRLQNADPRVENPMLSFNGAGIAPLSHPIWGYLFKLFDRPYFRRVWVVQEVALSQHATVLCGASSISWEELYQATLYVFVAGLTTLFRKSRLGDIANIEMARRDQVGSATRCPLSLILRHRNCEATDPRDQIFAFYGISEAGFQELGLDPDYNLSTRELYHRFAVLTLEKDLVLDILTAPRGLRRRQDIQESLPSWVPEWREQDGAYSLLRWEHEQSGTPFKAAGGSRASPLFDSDYHRLGLEGYIVDKITAVSRILSFDEPVDISGTTASQFWKQHSRSIRHEQAVFYSVDRVIRARSKKAYLDGQDIMDVYWITLRAGFQPEGADNVRQAFHRWYKSIRLLQLLYPLSHFLPVYYITGGLLGALAVVRHKLGIDKRLIKLEIDFGTNCAYNQRRVFRTEGGYIGLGPGLSAAGDQIGLFKGGKLPLVIRKGEEDWELLGDCFVTGMTKGQCWTEEKCERMWFI